jgi:hypothetical protein
MPFSVSLCPSTQMENKVMLSAIVISLIYEVTALLCRHAAFLLDAGASLSFNAAQSGSPESTFSTRGLDGTLLPAPPTKAQSQRPVSGGRSSDLESHTETHRKQKLQVKRKEVKKKPEPPIDLEEGEAPIPTRKETSEWFEAGGVKYCRGLKLNPEYISKNAEGEPMIFFPFLTFSDPRCDSTTGELADMLGVTDVRAWAFKLSELEAEPMGWSKPSTKMQPGVSILTCLCVMVVLLRVGTVQILLLS